MSTEPERIGDALDVAGRLRVLCAYTHIAVVGFSANPRRPGHFVAAYLQAEGYNLILVNPRYAGQTILGRPVYASLTAAHEAGEKIEIVNVFRRPQDLEPVVREAIVVGARVLWLQLGIRSEESRRRAMAAGIDFVQDCCIKTCRAQLHSVRVRDAGEQAV